LLDRAAAILIYIGLSVATLSIGVYVLREWFLRTRERRLLKRVQHLKSFLAELDAENAVAFRTVRRFSTLRDLEALERLLEERRLELLPESSPEELEAHFASYDELGILDRYVERLLHARRWAERAFAARVLGEIGNARAVEPLVEVMRNTREEDRDVRMAAGRALGRIRDPRALAPLIEALSAPESWLPPRVAEVILQFGPIACDALLERLATRGDPGARAWAAEILGELKQPKSVQALLTAMSDLQDQVRARAAGALGKIGDRRAVPDLIHLMLGDPVPYVRIQSVRALGAIGDARALHHLIDSLKDGEWWVRIRVIEALEQLGDDAIEPLILALEDSDTEVRQRAAMTLERLGVLDTLIERVGDGDVAAREQLVVAGQAGVVEVLIDALGNTNPRVRYAVAEILGEVRNGAVSVALIARLEQEDASPIKAEVLRSLARLREAHAAEPISRLLGDENDSIRVEAVRALERIPFPNPNELLASAVRDPEARVRAGAATVLGKVGDPHSVPALLELLADCDAGVRAEAARALGLLRASESMERLVDAFHDYVPEVQIAAARALGQVGRSECLETLVRGLENANPELGEAIAWALGQIQWHDPERVIDVLFQGADRTSRLGALDVLGQLGHEAGRQLVRSMLSDEDELVVCKAVQILGQLQDHDSIAELVELLHSPSEAVRVEVLDALCAMGDPSVVPKLRDAVFDPSERVRARSVLVLGALRDAHSGDLLRGVLASPRSTEEMRGYALLSLMVLDREQDLPTILEMLESFPLYDFLHDRQRTHDPILHATVESVRTQSSIEFMVASMRSRRELEAALLQQLEIAQEESVRVKVIRTLGFLRSQSAYPSVERTFRKDPSAEVRIAALQFLAECAPREEFVRLLLDGMQDLQARVRSEAMRRLHRIDVDDALQVVVSQLDTEDEGVLHALVDFLAELKPARLEAFLDGVMGLELPLRARQALVRVLGRTRFKGVAALLEAFLEANEPEMRRSTARTLSRLPARQVRKLLAGCFQDPDFEVRREALDAAAALGATSAQPLLRMALEDPAPELRRAALLHLARLKPRAARDDLKTLTRDAAPDVRAAALAALAVEGSEPVEEWVGPKDVPRIAAALREIHPVAELERRLQASRVVGERIGALRALFFHDPERRVTALSTARRDPSPRVRAAGVRLEEVLQVWLLDRDAERHLGTPPIVATSDAETQQPGRA
jgi:HEAT repeat protein